MWKVGTMITRAVGGHHHQDNQVLSQAKGYFTILHFIVLCEVVWLEMSMLLHGGKSNHRPSGVFLRVFWWRFCIQHTSLSK